jgi:RHS repeat-associated protein
MTDGSGSTKYCYDRFGDLVRKVQTTSGQVFTLRYAYTKGSRLSAVIYPDGAVVDYVRDAMGQVTEVGVTPAGGVRQLLLRQTTYYPFGPATGWTYGNGRSLSRTYDLDYRPQTILDGDTGGLDLGYGFDEVGNLDALTTAVGATPLLGFGYDGLGRLTRTEDGSTSTPLETYTYDATGNRTSFQNSTGTQAYAYPATSHHLLGVGGIPRTYDPAGNSISIGGTAREFVYDDTGRMSQAKSGGAIVATYAYNGRGERVSKQVGTGNTYTLYDEVGRWLGDYDGGGAPIQQAIWLDDLPVGLLAGGTQQLHYIEPDHLGTPRVVIDPVRDVAVWAWDAKSEAFGNSPPHEDPDVDGVTFVLDMRFPGQRYDSATGLNYNYFRDYDSGTARYAQSDSIGLVGGVSTYSYVLGRPLDGVDPLGLAGIFERCPTGMIKSCPWPFTSCSCVPDQRQGRCGGVDCLLLEGNHPKTPNNNLSLCQYDRLGNNVCYIACMSEESSNFSPQLGPAGDAANLIGYELNGLRLFKGAGGYGQAADYGISLFLKYRKHRICRTKCIAD